MEEINLPTSIKPTEEPSNMQTYKEDADFSSAFHLQKMSKTMFKNNKAEYRQKMYKKIGESLKGIFVFQQQNHFSVK